MVFFRRIKYLNPGVKEMKGHNVLSVLLILIMLSSLGCTGSGDPVLPDSPKIQSTQDQSAADSTSHLWGYWDCSMARGGTEIEIVQLRTAKFTANVNTLLEGNPGNLIIDEIDLTDYISQGRIDCTVNLKHPFPGIDQYHGFDVRGVFLHNSNGTLLYDGLTYGRSADEGDDVAVLLNPDGYTRWFNYPEFDGSSSPIFEFTSGKLSSLADPDATLNPYMIFADGLGSTDDYLAWIGDNTSDRGLFKAGAVNSRRYELDFPIIDNVPVLRFQYAVVANWEPGDPEFSGNPDIYDPDDFPTSANSEEAFFVNADSSESSLYYLDPSTFGGNFSMDLEIFDWQAGLTEATVPDEIHSIVIEADFLPGGTHEILPAEFAALASPGTSVSSVFQVDISGCQPQAGGDTPVWIIVESAGINGDSYGQGFPTEYPDPARRAAFHKSSVEISTEITGFTVISINPDTGPYQGSVDDAVVTGIGFVDGADVELRKDGEVPVVAGNVTWVSASEISCDLDLLGAVSGLWDVVVINPSLDEAILENGFTIEAWSEETETTSGSYRLPEIVEMFSGPLVLVAGTTGNMQYMVYTPDDNTWTSMTAFATFVGNAIYTALGSDKYADNVYYAMTPHHLYRFQGGSSWEDDEHPIAWNRVHRVTVDDNSKAVCVNNFGTGMTMSAMRQPWWGCDMPNQWEWPNPAFIDSSNALVMPAGNIITYDSTGDMYVTYIKDFAESYFYYNAAGPRYIRVSHFDGSDGEEFYSIVDSATGVTAYMDSPSIAIDPADNVHVSYRTHDGTWRIEHQLSDDGGLTWTPQNHIYEGADEPLKEYNFLHSDSDGDLHSVVRIDGNLEYRSLDAGSTDWNDVEIIDEDLTSDDQDFMPRAFVTTDDVLNVVWIRGNEGSGYGDIWHRMRDVG